jgi:hypothetical protein
MLLRYFFEFPEHLGDRDVASLVNGVASHGNVCRAGSEREYFVEVFRESNASRLKKLFEHNERFGFMRWRQEKLAP